MKASELMAESVRRAYNYTVDLALNTIPATKREINELRRGRGVDNYPAMPHFDKVEAEYSWYRAVLRDEKALAALREDPEMQAFIEWRKRRGE